MNRRSLLVSLLTVGFLGYKTESFANTVDEWEMLTEAFEIAAKYALFEFNNEKTRESFLAAVKPFCDEHGFYVKCDGENNPYAVIYKNQFIAEFYKNGRRRIYILSTEKINFEEATFE